MRVDLRLQRAQPRLDHLRLEFGVAQLRLRRCPQRPVAQPEAAHRGECAERERQDAEIHRVESRPDRRQDIDVDQLVEAQWQVMANRVAEI